MSSFKTIGVVGLGNMGRGMALSLQRAGFTVIGFDANPATAQSLAEEGIAPASSLKDLLAQCEALVLSLPTSAIVKTVVESPDGILANAKPGLLVLDTTTADPVVTRELSAKLAERQIAFLDTPVSGGPGGALRGEMTMFIGGTADEFARAQPVLAALGKNLFHVGSIGAGNIAKIINNLLTAAQLLTAGEAFRLARTAGVETQQLIEAVNAGSGRSGVTQFNYPNRILNGGFNSGFTMQLMRKDVRLAMSLAQSLGISLPVMEQVGELWKASEESLTDGDDFNRIVDFERAPGASA